MSSVPIRISLLAAVILVAGCAQQPPTHAQASAGATEGRRATLRCPVGTTMMCETRRTGRIHHGTFARGNDRCACVPEGMRPMESPVIPSTQ